MGGETTIISQALNALFFWYQFRGHTVTSYKVVIFAVIVFTVRMRFFSFCHQVYTGQQKAAAKTYQIRIAAPGNTSDA